MCGRLAGANLVQGPVGSENHVVSSARERQKVCASSLPTLILCGPREGLAVTKSGEVSEADRVRISLWRERGGQSMAVSMQLAPVAKVQSAGTKPERTVVGEHSPALVHALSIKNRCEGLGPVMRFHSLHYVRCPAGQSLARRKWESKLRSLTHCLTCFCPSGLVDL